MTRIYAVSGSASGIGKAVADSLAGEGHRVITLDIRDAQIAADLSNAEGRRAAIDALLAEAPDGLDGCVPSAGVGGRMGLSDQVLEVNYQGTVELLEAARPLLAKRNGAVVVVASTSMSFPDPDRALIDLLHEGDLDAAKRHVKSTEIEPYPSAKVALGIWMRRRAVEWIRQGVRMNAVAPGTTETGLIAAQRSLSPEFAEAIESFAAETPMGHAADPQMIADAILFLLSDKARFVCGEVLYVDGGHAAALRPEHV